PRSERREHESCPDHKSGPTSGGGSSSSSQNRGTDTRNSSHIPNRSGREAWEVNGFQGPAINRTGGSAASHADLCLFLSLSPETSGRQPDRVHLPLSISLPQ